MSDFVRPVDKVEGVLRAGGATLAEAVERTGYPDGKVMELIGRLRSEGVRVNAIAGARTDDGWEPTRYTVDSGSGKE